MNRIKHYIDSSKKSIKTISKETGINYTTLTNYYRGERTPRKTETWNILANYFNTPVSYLMGFDEEVTDNQSIENKQLTNLKQKEKIIKNLANLDSDCYNSFSELILDLNNLMEVKLNDSDSDLLFIKSIIKDSIDYAVLFSKQKKFINEAINMDKADRDKLERTLFGLMSQEDVNDKKREIAERLSTKIQ